MLIIFNPSPKMATASMFAVGDTFHSFEELSSAIRSYQITQKVQFYIRDSRTIEAASRRDTKKTFKRELKYAEITYHCIHGGKQYKPTSKGKRPHQLYVTVNFQFYCKNCYSSFRKNCPCNVRFRASCDGKSLVLKSINENHNHDLSQVIFTRYYVSF